MNKTGQWLFDFAAVQDGQTVADGLIPVQDYSKVDRPPEEVAVMEKAVHYGADAVFFEAPRDGKPPIAQAFIYRSDGPEGKELFANLHRRLWSWGGVPLVYRVSGGLVELFRCAHRPDFEKAGKVVFKPFKMLEVAANIAGQPWWDADRIRSGTLWDEPDVCKKLLSSNLAVQKTLIKAVKDLHDELDAKSALPKPLQRRLLIISLLIAYLEARRVFEEGYFSRFKGDAEKFFQILADGPALVTLLEDLEKRFNGNVFELSDDERKELRNSSELVSFAILVEARREKSGQLTIWERYSFEDLPVELISHVYQLFVDNKSLAVYTPQFLVRMMLGEVLSWKRLDRLVENDEIILDGSCGSGIFLVEAYKRLVLHWRYRNGWERPGQAVLKQLLTSRLRGVDLEPGAVELAAFSLCLALCDALEPEEIRVSVKLFPPLKNETIHEGCFFEARQLGSVKGKIGVVVGNPPFASKLGTEGARLAYRRYRRDQGALPDRQLAYLFLHESMEMLAPGGALAMLQQYNFLYNQQSLGFRQKFIGRWDVREILDFISVRGLFQKGSADTKVIVVVAEAKSPPPERQILHATFRRSGRTDAEQGFDIDYYDMHWLPREVALANDGIWRSNLLGGGRVLAFVDRLKKNRTLIKFADDVGWDFGEGFIAGGRGVSRPAAHIVGRDLLPSEAITEFGIDERLIQPAPDTPIEGPRSEKRFTPPMLLIREQMDLPHGIWTKGYLTYRDQVVGLCAPETELSELTRVSQWLSSQRLVLAAYTAAVSTRLFSRKATAISSFDIASLPYPSSANLNISPHEEMLVSDIVDYYRDLIRLGEDSAAMKERGMPALVAFNDIFTSRINGVYKKNQLRTLKEQNWPGVICQPYIFGPGDVDWSNADELKERLDALLIEKNGAGINVTRIARIYDGAFIYLIKPDRLRYWLKSIALRDADETLADLAAQGF